MLEDINKPLTKKTKTLYIYCLGVIVDDLIEKYFII
jgi:hypothetical protein